MRKYNHMVSIEILRFLPKHMSKLCKLIKSYKISKDQLQTNVKINPTKSPRKSFKHMFKILENLPKKSLKRKS